MHWVSCIILACMEFELITVNFCLKHYMDFIKAAFSKCFLIYIKAWAVVLFTTSEQTEI